MKKISRLISINLLNIYAKKVCNKLQKLRKLMKEKNFNSYLIYRSDKHDVYFFYEE